MEGEGGNRKGVMRKREGINLFPALKNARFQVLYAQEFAEIGLLTRGTHSVASFGDPPPC